jgi:O-antigen/teichoic acid export membrane protein
LIPLFGKAGALNSQVPLRSLKRNFFFSAVSAVLAIAYPIVSMAYVARALGPESLGKYYFASSLAVYFLFAAGMGLPVYGAREVSRLRGNPEGLGRVFGELFLIGLIATGITVVLYAGTVVAVPEFRRESLLMAIFGLGFVTNALTFDYLYAGLERQDWIAYRSAASKLLSIVLIFVFVRGPEDYIAFGAITVATGALNAAFALGGLKRASLKNPFALDLRRHLKPLFLIMGSLLFLNVYLLLDSVILGFFSGPHEVGLYGSVVKPCRAISMLASTITAAALPRLSQYRETIDREGSLGLQRKSFEILCLITVPVFLGALVAAPRVVVLISGPEFAEASSTLRLAAPLILMNSLAAFTTYQILLPFGKERLFLGASAVLALVNLIFNFALVPFLGREGTVLAALIAEGVFLLLLAALLRKEGALRAFGSSNIWKYWAAGAGSAAVLYAGGFWKPESSMAFVPVCLAAMAAYAVLLWVLREPVIRQAGQLVLARFFAAPARF